jgi:molybdopterin molybdotransferase
MISYNEAVEIIKREFSSLILETEIVKLENSYGRILAEEVYSDVDLPPFDNSAMDGYAIKYSDRTKWKIKGEVVAGEYKEFLLDEDEAVLITTGSKAPEVAGLVIPIEDVIATDNEITLRENVTLKESANIRPRGNDLKKGTIAVQSNTKISPKVMAVLASCGKSQVRVFKKLNVGIIVTGTELIPVDEIPAVDKIRISNSYSLIGAVIESGHTPVYLGHVTDDNDHLESTISNALKSDIDISITTGGVSVGKYDLLKEVFHSVGVEEKYWRVNIKPGKPGYFGVYNRAGKIIPVFGLPGNPVSSLVNFYILIKPALRSLYNLNDEFLYTAILQNDMIKKDNKRHFSRGILYTENGKWKVKSGFSQSSGNLAETSKANCLIIIPEEIKNPKKGDTLECMIM